MSSDMENQLDALVVECLRMSSFSEVLSWASKSKDIKPTLNAKKDSHRVLGKALEDRGVCVFWVN